MALTWPHYPGAVETIIYAAYLLIAMISIAGWLLLAYAECREGEETETKPLVSADCALLSHSRK